MDKLTLEQLAPYLPYGLPMMMCNGKIGFLSQITQNNGFGIQSYKVDLKTIQINGVTLMHGAKPILLPLSDIDIKFFQDNIDPDLEDFLINCEPDKGHLSVEVCEKVLGWSALAYEEYQLFFKHHFDVFGLINAGLAVDINTLKGGFINGN